MKLATFNINGVRSRLDALLEWLAREQPDVACLQELKAPDDVFPVRELADAGYHALWHGQRSWNGVAILSRGAPPVEVRRGLPDAAGDDQSRYLEAAVDGILVACLYLPNGNPQPGPKFAYKLAWFERLIARAAVLLDSGHPVVLAGDFNVVPTDLDIYDPRSWRKDALLQPESRACFERLLAQGWTDSLRALHPEQRVYTFWDYFRQHWQRNAGLRIDHLLLSPSLAPHLAAAGVDAWVRGEPRASDHAPTWIELNGLERVRGKAPRASTKRASVRTRAAKPAEKTVPSGAPRPPATRSAAKPVAKPAAAAKRTAATPSAMKPSAAPRAAVTRTRAVPGRVPRGGPVKR